MGLFDVSFSAAKVALDGLATRQQAISRNMANVDTPGYRAQTISFERAVRMAAEQDENFKMKTTNTRHMTDLELDGGISHRYRPGGSLRADGNNVDVDVELVDMTETVMRYETVTQTLGKKYRLLTELSRAR
jgi:flagellar basal-body rod protein FlgB